MKTILFTLLFFASVSITKAQVTTINAKLLNPCAKLSVSEASKNIDFSIFPNPNTGIVNIQLNNSLVSNPKVKIYDMFGKLVFEKNKFENIPSNKFTILIDSLTEGIYLISVEINKSITTKKLIISK